MLVVRILYMSGTEKQMFETLSVPIFVYSPTEICSKSSTDNFSVLRKSIEVQIMSSSMAVITGNGNIWLQTRR